VPAFSLHWSVFGKNLATYLLTGWQLSFAVGTHVNTPHFNTSDWRENKQLFASEIQVTLFSIKGATQPRTGHEGPVGDYMYSVTPSLTSALDGVGGQRHSPAGLPQRKTHYPLYRRLRTEPIGSSVPVRAHYLLLALPLPRSNPTRYKYPTQSFHWHTFKIVSVSKSPC